MKKIFVLLMLIVGPSAFAQQYTCNSTENNLEVDFDSETGVLVLRGKYEIEAELSVSGAGRYTAKVDHPEVKRIIFKTTGSKGRPELTLFSTQGSRPIEIDLNCP